MEKGTTYIGRAKDRRTLGVESANPLAWHFAEQVLAPVAGASTRVSKLLVVPANAPYNTGAELVAAARQPGAKLSMASSGTGSVPHLAAEQLNDAARINLLHVPYKGGGAVMTDLIAGHVDLLFASVLESIGHVKAGKMKALAVTTTVRSDSMPEVPTVAESGLPGYESGSWLALLAPGGTPKDLVDKIAADMKTVLADESTRQALIQQGAIPRSSTPAQLQTLIDNDRKRYERIIRDKHISID